MNDRVIDSARIDRLLGFEYSRVESSMAQMSESGSESLTSSRLWQEVGPQGFQTPYHELADIASSVGHFQRLAWADLGAGYSRLAILLKIIRPNDHYWGIELSPQRVEEAKRVLSDRLGKNFDFCAGDLLKDLWLIPSADMYLIYDFSSPSEIEKILRHLVDRDHPFGIVARGKGVRSLIEAKFPLLSDVYPCLYRDKWTIYFNHETQAIIEQSCERNWLEQALEQFARGQK